MKLFNENRTNQNDETVGELSTFEKCQAQNQTEQPESDMNNHSSSRKLNEREFRKKSNLDSKGFI